MNWERAKTATPTRKQFVCSTNMGSIKYLPNQSFVGMKLQYQLLLKNKSKKETTCLSSYEQSFLFSFYPQHLKHVCEKPMLNELFLSTRSALWTTAHQLIQGLNLDHFSTRTWIVLSPRTCLAWCRCRCRSGSFVPKFEPVHRVAMFPSSSFSTTNVEFNFVTSLVPILSMCFSPLND